MKATVKDFFGSNLEQEVLDEVAILPVAIRNAGTGTITLPVGMKWTDFEYIEVAVGVSTSSTAHTPHTISGALIKNSPSSWSARSAFDNGTLYGLTIVANSDNTAQWSSFGGGSINYPHYMIGYKRRISRVGIDELMSAMSLPNLIANADLTDNPINQRGFNGNWSSLAVGAYGYDQWMKVSSTHMGYVVEAGKYRPNAKHTLTKDDVVLGEFMSPASGHWIVSVPFATSGKFDLYAGQFKRPWHPVQDGEVRCQRHYISCVITASYNNAHEQTYATKTLSVDFPVTMRKSPAVQIYKQGTGSINTPIVSNFGFYNILSGCLASTNPYLTHYIADASITLAEVAGQITTV